MTDREKLKSYYKYKPLLKFIKNNFFGGELKNLYEDKIQILCLQYALQLLWVAEVVWIEDLCLSRSRVQELIIDELTAEDLIKVVQKYQLTYKNPWEQALVILVVLINRLWFPDREENKYEVMRVKNPVLEEMLTKLAARMKTVKGKKQYGYLDRHTKKQVDEIVKRIAEDEKNQELYELWYQCQCEIYRTYTDIMPPKEPIEKNDVFKSLRNSVVKFALDITAIPDMADYNGHYSYEPNAFRKTDVQKAKDLLSEGKHDEAWTVLLDKQRKNQEQLYPTCVSRCVGTFVGNHFFEN